MNDQELAERKARGALLRGKRESKQLSQAELGELVGVTRATISYWETGKYEIELENALRLAQHVELDLSDLLSTKRYEAMKPLEIRDAEYKIIDAKEPAAVRESGQVLNDDALNVALLWQMLPEDASAKIGARKWIEQAHQQQFPDYWKWSRKVRRDSDTRPPKTAKRKKARKRT